jgi:large subunit ribosomal protein L24
MKIHKDDPVIVIAGKGRGTIAKVVKAFPDDNKVLVE